MPLRDRKDCTLEELVPKALAIHSSLRPSSTQRLMSSMNFLRETLWFMPTFAHRLPIFRPSALVNQLTCVADEFPARAKPVVNFAHGHLYRLRGRGLAPRAPYPRLLHTGPHGDGACEGARGELQDQGRPGLRGRLRRGLRPATALASPPPAP